MPTKLLIADDHVVVRAGVEAMLAGSGYQIVASVADGNAVLDEIPRCRPQMLLLDVEMPERTGVDVLRTLRARGDNRPIILFTADLRSSAAIEAIQLGVNGVLLKESAPALLRTCLDAVRNGGRWIDRSILEQALATSMEQEGRRGKLSALSVKERAIVGLITKGLRNRQIADELGLTEGTVKVHLHNIYAKLGVANRTELAMVAEREQP